MTITGGTTRVLAVAALSIFAAAGVGLSGSAAAAPTASVHPAAGSTTPPGPAVCPRPTPGRAECLTYLAPGSPKPNARLGTASPVGLGADDLRAAYRVPDRASHTTVAVSIWHNAPRLAHDLNVYRARYGLTPCTTGSGCLRIVNQSGRSAPLPPDEAGVALETTLDVSMISAACPTCRILVVEANSNATADLAATEVTAKRLGASVISNSYGDVENASDITHRAAYEQRGVVTVAASGDAGFATLGAPAAYPSVVSVGGTVLSHAANARGWSEQAWTYGSSGCSGYFAKPAWQHDPGCGTRLSTDISGAAANIALYDSQFGGWFPVFGTSASAPFAAGLFGLAGNARTVAPGSVYTHPGAFFDVTSGTNDAVEKGRACENTYLCVAKPGYDAPTGLGTPDGIAGF